MPTDRPEQTSPYVKLVITDRDGGTREVRASLGTRLMTVIRDEVDLSVGICAGVISCGTCLVRVSPEWAGVLAAPGGEEVEMREALGGDELCRLACQLVLDESADGMTATLLGAD